MTNNDTYRKIYKMRLQGQDGLNTVVSIPPEVIEREARKRGLTIKEFIEQYRAVAEYDGFEGIRYNFQPIKQEEGVKDGPANQANG